MVHGAVMIHMQVLIPFTTLPVPKRQAPEGFHVIGLCRQALASNEYYSEEQTQPRCLFLAAPINKSPATGDLPPAPRL